MSAPDSEGQLWDYLQKHFGTGDWDALAACEQPFWRYRALEITKIKRSRFKRQVAVVELYIAAEYCRAHRIDIRNFAWLYQHIPDSKRWWAERCHPAKGQDFEALYEEAISIEFGISASPWLDRMFRAEGAAREEVYEEWLQARRHTSAS